MAERSKFICPAFALTLQHSTNLFTARNQTLRMPGTAGHALTFLVLGYEHPVVLPQVSHFIQVPFRTSVKLPHSEHISPS